MGEQQNEMVFNLTVNPDTIDEEVKKAIDLHRILREPDFEAWFDEWEKGFPKAVNQREAGNFQLGGETPWRGQPDQRPRFREWTSKEQRIKWGFRQIEYWRNRANESESIFLQGTDRELIDHIIQIEYEAGGSAARKGDKGLPPLKGQPEIMLYFIEDKAKEKHRKIEAEKSFRIVDKTDNPDSKLDKISNADLKRYADRIIANFYEGKQGIIWEKGREVVSYKGDIPRGQGFDGWIYCKNKAAGIAIFDRMAKIVEKKVERKFLRHTITEDEAGAYPASPETVQVLGKPYELPLKRPLCDVRFYKAEIILPFSRQTKLLVLGGKIAPDLL